MEQESQHVNRQWSTIADACPIGDVLHDAVKYAQPFMTYFGVAVKVDADPDIGTAPGDALQIAQVLIDLMFNAADSMGQSREKILTVTARRAERDIRIDVASTGVPVEADAAMGLSVCKRIIEEHRGTLTLQTYKQGNVFTITLPLKNQNTES